MIWLFVGIYIVTGLFVAGRLLGSPAWKEIQEMYPGKEHFLPKLLNIAAAIVAWPLFVGYIRRLP